jgi:uncharacterized hydrophobic protein (TIGR00271 family)
MKGVWGVKDFYTALDEQSREDARFTGGYSLLVFIATVIATAGLLADNSAIIIAAMCIAPFVGPARAVSIGLVYRNPRTFSKGLAKQVLGLFIMTVPIAYTLTILLDFLTPFFPIGVTHEILLRATFASKDFIIAVMISIVSSMAVPLALLSTPKMVGESVRVLVDVIIGVSIAIALVPPASVIGIGLAMNAPEVPPAALTALLVNLVGLDFVGSLITLKGYGVRKDNLLIERRIREVSRQVAIRINEKSRSKIQDLVVSVTMNSYNRAHVQVTVHLLSQSTPRGLAKGIGRSIEREMGIPVTVSVRVIPLQYYVSPQVENEGRSKKEVSAAPSRVTLDQREKVEGGTSST